MASAAPPGRRRGRPPLFVPVSGVWPDVLSSKELARRLGVPHYVVDVLAVVYEIPRLKAGAALVFDRAGQKLVRDAVAEYHEARERLAADQGYLFR
jgi:hypothetical protein